MGVCVAATVTIAEPEAKKQTPGEVLNTAETNARQFGTDFVVFLWIYLHTWWIVLQEIINVFVSGFGFGVPYVSFGD